MIPPLNFPSLRLIAFISIFLFARIAAAESPPPPDPCAQPSPEEMAKQAGVTLPRLPWHLTDIWWDFDKPTEHFQRLEIDVTIDRDVPPTYNLYVSPCGIAEINHLEFYGGLQTNINGWPNKESRERVFPGKGAIFSRWSADKKTLIGLDHARPAADGLVESAGYEGEFASVRRPLAWGAGKYTYQIVKGETEKQGEKSHTWFLCRVRDPQGGQHEIGSLRFEGDDFSFWPRHAAFVEVYSTAKIPNSGIPKVNVTFGYPRINGQPPSFKKATAVFPAKGTTGSPACAKVRAEGENVVVEVGPIFKRDPAKAREKLAVRVEAGD
jgi:hypothetical protein